jgi:hypothetical protein
MHRAHEIKSAIKFFTELPGFHPADSRMRAVTESILREMETQQIPRLQAITWFDAHAECFLPLVVDHASWNAYRILLYDLWFPQAYEYLFGWAYAQPLQSDGIRLANQLEARRRDWHRRASEALANCSGGDSPPAQSFARECQVPEDGKATDNVMAGASSHHSNHAPEGSRADSDSIGCQTPNDEAKGEAPAPASWDDVEISVANDFEVQIVVRGRRSRAVGFEEMGFADGRGKAAKKPNKLWDLLVRFARYKGRIDSAQQVGLAEWKMVEQRVWALNGVLKRHFRIPDGPIRFVRGGYECTFKIKANSWSDL